MSTLYVLKEGQKWGPYSTDEVKDHVAAGSFILQDLAWKEGLDDWVPLHTLIIEEDAKTDPKEVYFEEGNIRITADSVTMEDKDIPLHAIAKAGIQIERVRRLKPLIGGVIVGVIALCVALVEIPKQTASHWVVWVAILAGLVIWWLRLMFVGLRTPSSLVVLDLADGNERLLQVKPETAKRFEKAIQLALADAKKSLHH